jgi:hypothetical protein
MKKEAILAFRQMRDDIQKNESIVLVITAVVSAIVAIGLLSVSALQYSIASQQLALSSGQLELGNKQVELSNKQLELGNQQSEITGKQFELSSTQLELNKRVLRPWLEVDYSNFPFISVKNIGNLPGRIDRYTVSCNYDGANGTAYDAGGRVTIFPQEKSNQFYVRKSTASCGTALNTEGYLIDIYYSSPSGEETETYTTIARLNRDLKSSLDTLEYIEVT